MNVFTKKGKKKMSVNCVMKLKPLVLNDSLVPQMEQRWGWGGCESYLGSTPALLGQQVDVNLNVKDSPWQEEHSKCRGTK